MKNEGRKTFLGTAAVFFVSALILYRSAAGFWDAGILDRMHQRPSVTNKKIYIIAIDDRTLERYGSVSSWSREIPAGLVEILTEDPEKKPAVIGFDVIYSERGDEEGDLRFARACREAGNVVAAFSFSFKAMPGDPFHVDHVIAPYKELRDQVSLGYANTTVDPDGYVRQAMAWMDYEGERYLSLSSRIYRSYEESRGREARFPSVYGRNNRFYFSYSGKPGSYNTVSMADVLDGTVDPVLFRDAIVLVGAYAAGMQDSYTPAISHNSQMYGVEIHANIIEALLEGRTQLPLSPVIYGLGAGLVCALFFLGSRKGKIGITLISLAAAAVVDVVLVRVMYRRGILMPAAPLPVLLAIISLGRIIQGYAGEILRRRRVVSVFKQYVAPQVVDKISRDADFQLVLGGENRHIAVLFVDIRGFTTMSENLRPEEVVEILNEYLDLTTRSIFDNGGTLDKCVGDAAMAVFNAPFELDDYIFRAVSTAWDMKEKAEAVSGRVEERFGNKVSFGVGIHCGEAVVGNIGCEFRMDYTAIGDTVNTAARLENHAAGGQILISDSVYEAIKDRIQACPIGQIPLKGKSNGVFVYQVDGVKK